MHTLFLKPMEPVLRNTLIEESDFIHQIKWDGIRGISYIINKQLILKTKKNIDITSKYPELQSIITKNFIGKSAILDGEIVLLDEKGKPNFQNIIGRHMLKSKIKIDYFSKHNPVYYIVFDIIFLDEKDLRLLPYCNRKAILNKSYNNDSLSAVTDDFSNSISLFNIMKEKNMEGIVSKNINSPYISGKKHNFWFKTKLTKKMLAIIGGIKFNNQYPASLLLGIYHKNDLLFIGNVSSGLKQADLYILKDHVTHLKIPESPFANHPKASDTVWLKPELTCLVGFFERTNSGHLRHPELLGFTNENPKDICGEEMIADDSI